MRRWFRNRDGATAVEYGLIAGLIAVAIIGGVSSLGNSSNGMWAKTGGAMNTYLR